MKKTVQLKELIDPLYPNLFSRIKKLIEDSESSYSSKRTEAEDSFLWEHTRQVATIAEKICVTEGVDPQLPVIAALFHDIGKFTEGQYHQDEIPEEKIASEQAHDILSQEGMDEALTGKVVAGLVALYNEKSTGNQISDIVHDADFLIKSGYLGVAHFFIKSALRGYNLFHSILESLSRELTYADVLPDNMRTAAGKKMAVRKRQDTLAFYRGFLQELRETGIARFTIKETTFRSSKNSQKSMKIILVVPEVCPDCGGELDVEHSSKQGIKCEKLTSLISCLQCPKEYKISFCLPEI